MIPDPALMLTVACELEETAHREGWDSLPPMLGAVTKLDGNLACFMLPAQPMIFADTFVEGVEEITENLRGLRQQGRESQNPGELCGVWVVAESWVHSTDGIAPGKIADTIGAREVRQCFVLDFAGRLHVAHRERDKDVLQETFEPGVCPVLFHAGLIPALRDLVLEHALWLDDGAVDVLAVSLWQESVDA